jgi:NADPH:quinone reductase-like Zn-dependent oxidoreductase
MFVFYPFIGCGKCEFVSPAGIYVHSCKESGRKIGWHLCRLCETAGENCFASPAGFTFAEVAPFPLVFVTLWRMLITNAQLQPGEGLLMIGIRGGMPSASLQVAEKIDARVIVTSGIHESWSGQSN